MTKREDGPGTLEHALDEATSAFGTGFWEYKERDHMADAVRNSQWLADHNAQIRAEVIDWIVARFGNDWRVQFATREARQHFGLTQ